MHLYKMLCYQNSLSSLLSKFLKLLGFFGLFCFIKLTTALIPAMDVFMLQQNIKLQRPGDRPKSLALEQAVIPREDICPRFCAAASTHCCFWLGCFALCFPFVLLNGSARRAHRHKRKEHQHWVLAGPGALHNPSSYCSTFHSVYLLIGCMTKTCNQKKYRWEGSLDNEIPCQIWAAKLREIAPCNS